MEKLKRLAYVDNKGENGRKSQFCKLLLFESVYTVYCTAQKNVYTWCRGCQSHNTPFTDSGQKKKTK